LDQINETTAKNVWAFSSIFPFCSRVNTVGPPPERGASSAYYCSGVKRPPAGQGASSAYSCSSSGHLPSVPPPDRSECHQGTGHQKDTIMFIMSTCHRLGRVLSCSPDLPLWFGEEGHTRWRKKGWESPNSDEGTYTVVLYIYMYFVVRAF
jgi:hypothetical protein